MIAYDELRARFLDAQLRGDRKHAAKIVIDDGLSAGAPVAELYEHVLGGAQREIGRLWQENEVTVAQEHMATAIAGLVLAQLFERASMAPRNGRLVLVACVEGELHDFPARLVADTLDLAGFSVRFLGANVPIDDLLAMIADAEPDLLALSATMSFHAPSLRRTVRAVRERFGAKPVIAAGGGALEWTPSLAAELGVDVTARTGNELVDAATRLLEIG